MAERSRQLRKPRYEAQSLTESDSSDSTSSTEEDYRAPKRASTSKTTRKVAAKKRRCDEGTSSCKVAAKTGKRRAKKGSNAKKTGRGRPNLVCKSKAKPKPKSRKCNKSAKVARQKKTVQINEQPKSHTEMTKPRSEKSDSTGDDCDMDSDDGTWSPIDYVPHSSSSTSSSSANEKHVKKVALNLVNKDSKLICSSDPKRRLTEAGPSGECSQQKKYQRARKRQSSSKPRADFTYRVDDILRFKFLSKGTMGGDAVEYAPTYVRHVFPDEEIRGFENLKIDVAIENSLMWCTLSITCKSIATDVKLAFLIERIERYIPFFQLKIKDPARGNPQELAFNNTFWKELFRFHLPGQCNTLTGAVGETGNQAFMQFHKVIRNISLWFADGPIVIHAENPHNQVFYVWYHCGDLKLNIPMGFCICIRLSDDDCKLSIRLGHLFVLPPYAHLGIPERFLDGITRHLRNTYNFVDLVVGRQCEEFKTARNNNLLTYLVSDKKFVNEILAIGDYSDAIMKRLTKEFLTTDDEARFLFDMIHYIHINHEMLPKDDFNKGLFDRMNKHMQRNQFQEQDSCQGYKPSVDEIVSAVKAYTENRLQPAYLSFERIRKNVYDIQLVPDTPVKRGKFLFFG